MKSKYKAFPYPVLSQNSDDVLPNVFSATLSVSTDKKSYFLDFNFTLQNTTLLSLISKHEVEYAVRVECRSNFFRYLFRCSESTGRIQISAEDLIGSVQISFFLIAAIPLENYSVDGAHSDYLGMTFPVRQGDVLAIASPITFDADKEYDPLKKIASIMQVCPADDLLEGRASVDLGHDKITIYLSKKDHEKYAQLKNTNGVASILVQTISFPALVEAIVYMKGVDPEEEQSEEDDKRWFRVIKHRLLEVGGNYRDSSKSAFDLVQLILSNPLGRCIGEMMMLTERMESE